MKLITFCTLVTVWLLGMASIQAQDPEILSKIEVLEATKDRIVEEEKDALKDSFLQTGCFSELSGFPKYPPIQRQVGISILAICSTELDL